MRRRSLQKDHREFPTKGGHGKTTKGGGCGLGGRSRQNDKRRRSQPQREVTAKRQKEEVANQEGGLYKKTTRVVFAKRPKDLEDEEVLRNKVKHSEAGPSDFDRRFQLSTLTRRERKGLSGGEVQTKGGLDPQIQTKGGLDGQDESRGGLDGHKRDLKEQGGGPNEHGEVRKLNRRVPKGRNSTQIRISEFKDI